MSIFGTILSKVFGGNKPAEAAPQGGAPQSEGAPPTAPTSPAPPPGEASASGGASASAAPQSGGAKVDVAQILDGMASHAGQKLDWRHSIVDLMKLLGMDSSLTARKELAKELHFTGNTNDSASMNIWLHKQVMTKFAEHGGHLPPELKH